MTTTGQESADGEGSVKCITVEDDSVPQQLKEIDELVTLIIRKLEDYAIERKAQISRDQWRTFESNSVTEKSWEQSVLARTYFTEKTLDKAFQHLISYPKIFSEHLKNFMAFLQGAENSEEVQIIRNHCSDRSMDNVRSEGPVVEPLDLSTLTDQCVNYSRRKRRTSSNSVLSIKNSFANVIKAKVTFDTKFLGFEAVLRKAASCSLVNSCQSCSKTGARVEEHTKVPRRTRRKRLTRSARILTKKGDKN